MTYVALGQSSLCRERGGSQSERLRRVSGALID